MRPSCPDVPQSFAACSRVFSKRDVLSEVMGLQSNLLFIARLSSRGVLRTKAPAAWWPGSAHCHLNPAARPARVLSAGRRISDRHAGNSVILCPAGQRAREVEEQPDSNSPRAV